MFVIKENYKLKNLKYKYQNFNEILKLLRLGNYKDLSSTSSLITINVVCGPNS